MRPALIFCPNHTAILPSLEIISANPNRPIKIIISRPEIRTLLGKISLPTNIKLHYLPVINTTVASFSPRAIIHQRKTYRYVYQRYFARIKNHDIYFFNHVFWDFGLKLVQDLSLNNRIYFWNLFKLTRITERLPVVETMLRFLFNLKHIAVFNNLNLPCPAITDQFISSSDIRLVIPRPDFQLTEKFRRQLIPGRNNYKVLILPSGDYAVPEVDKTNYQKNYEQVLNILLKRYKPSQILVKPHPGISEYVPYLNRFIRPGFNDIPAELMLSPQTELLLSTKATTLGFHRPYLKKMKRFSLLYIFYPPSAQRDIFDSMLKAMPTQIAYPKHHAKLRQLINSYES